MPREELPPDPDAVSEWQQMQKNKPSRDALPPATGGMRWLWGLLILLALLAVVFFVFQGGLS